MLFRPTPLLLVSSLQRRHFQACTMPVIAQHTGPTTGSACAVPLHFLAVHAICKFVAVFDGMQRCSKFHAPHRHAMELLFGQESDCCGAPPCDTRISPSILRRRGFAPHLCITPSFSSFLLQALVLCSGAGPKMLTQHNRKLTSCDRNI